MKKLRLTLYLLKRRIINTTISIFSWPDKIPYFLGMKTAERGSMPDFIIAGLPKCGTVWLVEALDSDKNFQYVKNPFFSHKGEVRFFSLNFNQPISKYLNTFKSIREDNSKKLLFEKSPDYSTMGKWRLKLLRKLNPQIKIILIFREPIERAFSNAKMDLIRVRKIELKPENDHYFLKNYKSVINLYDYKRILDNWYSVFDESQILILSMEDIKENPNQILEKTYHFLGKEFKGNYSEAARPKNVTVAQPIPNTHKAYLEKNLSQTINFWKNNQSLFRLNK